MLESHYLGIDIGSVSASVVLVDGSGRPQGWFHDAHRGNPREALREFLKQIGPVPIHGIGLTAGSPCLLAASQSVDAQCALITGARYLVAGVRSILFVGGEKFGLIRLAPDGSLPGNPGQLLLRRGNRELPGPAGTPTRLCGCIRAFP